MDYELREFVQREYKLTRCLEKDSEGFLPRDLKPKRVILIGAGAVENSWDPLLEVLRNNPPVKLPEKQEELYNRCRDVTEHVIANASFIYRSIRSRLISKSLQGNLDAKYFNDSTPIIESFYDFRRNMALSFKDAQAANRIWLRNEIENIEKMIDPSDVGVITTNWDELLWERKDIPNLVQLHGRVEYDQSLIFPTELTTEEQGLKNLNLSSIPVQQDPNISHPDLLNFIQGKCLRGNIYTELDMAHDTAVHWLSAATEVVVWGLGFNVYDAELNSVVNVSNHPQEPLHNLTVFDIDRSKAELAARLFLFPINKMKFERVKAKSCIRRYVNMNKQFFRKLC